MTKNLIPVRIARSPLTYALVVLVVIAAKVSIQGVTTPELSGKWRMNRERSEELEEALQSSGIRGQRAGRSGPNSDLHDGESDQTRRRIEALIEASETLDIREDEKEVTVLEGNLRERKFYTDGRPYQREDRLGNRITVRARWRGKRLVVDTKLADGGRITESYELAPGGQQLIVSFTSADRRLKQPLVIHRVYDAVPSAND